MRFDYLILYRCSNLNLDVARTITETDAINAIIAARAQERATLGTCCARCTLIEVKPLRAA